MVRTRSGRQTTEYPTISNRRLFNQIYRNLENQPYIPSPSSSQSSSIQYNYTPPTDQRHIYFSPRYRPNDSAKRHRLPDEEEKDEKVVSYTRRPTHR